MPAKTNTNSPMPNAPKKDLKRLDGSPKSRMTLPKGFGSGGSGGTSSADVERMIGKRVENMTGMITASYLAAWLATFGGTAAGYFYYPWAYPTPSGHYAFIVLTIIEAIGYIFCVKVMQEGSNKNSNGVVAAAIAGTAVGTVLIALYVGN